MITINEVAYYGEIYTRINTVNGKVYVGQCTREDDPRWDECLEEARVGRGFRLGAAIRKHGEKVFIKERTYLVKLQEDLGKCKKELDRMETFFILLRQSHISKNGYNCTLGGGSQSLEVRANRSLMYKERGYGSWNKGKPSKKRRASKNICYCCFKSFNAENYRDQIFCSLSCSATVLNTLRWTKPRKKSDSKQWEVGIEHPAFASHVGISSDAFKYSTKNTIWINNGIERKRIPSSAPIPTNWIRGKSVTNVT